MRTRRLLRSWPLLLWLTLVWVGLWGSVTAANVLGGLAVSAVLVALLPLPETEHQRDVRPLALVRFAGFFALELVRASLTVVGQVLRPRAELRQAVIAVRARGTSDRLLTLVANAISLTPGTLTLEVDRETSTLYVHVLDVGHGPDAVDRARASILELERRAVLALGTAESLQALEDDARAAKEAGS